MRLIALAALLPLAGCDGGSTTRSFPLRDFDRIEATGADRLSVEVGGPFSVSAEGNAERLKGIEMRVEDRALIIKRHSPGVHWSGWGWWRSFTGDRVRMTITLPALQAVKLTGAERMRIEALQGASFTAVLAGDPRIDIRKLAVKTARFDMAGAGEIRASGSAEALSAKLAGGGELRLRGLAAKSADIEVAGAGKVRAAVDGPARVRALGAGSVDLGPNARCTITRAGPVRVRCGG